jgi:hypothetical protein
MPWRRGAAGGLLALVCGLASVAGAAPAPDFAPTPTARPGAAAPAPAATPASPDGGAGVTATRGPRMPNLRIPVPRPPAPSGLSRSGAVEAAAAQAFDILPRPRPRPTGTGSVPPQDLTAAANHDMADDGPMPAHGAAAPGEITGGTRSGFARTGLALIGIFGAPGEWRALVRLPAGKVDYVHVGARIGDWQVAAINGRQVELIRGLQRQMLTVPNH